MPESKNPYLSKADVVAALVDLPDADQVKAVIVLGCSGHTTVIAKSGAEDDTHVRRAFRLVASDQQFDDDCDDDLPAWVRSSLLELARRSAISGGHTP